MNVGNGVLELVLPDGQSLTLNGEERGPTGRLAIKHYRCVRRLMSAGAIGFAEGAASAKARIKGILASDEAQTRRALADKLAFDTDLDVAQAIEILSASPAVAALGRLAREMASYRQPDLGSGVAADRVEPPNEFENGAAAARALLGLRPPVESGPSRFSINR